MAYEAGSYRRLRALTRRGSLLKELQIYIDGASKGNPGDSGVGVIIFKGEEVFKNVSKFIGKGTNNHAEYMALIYGLQEALILKASDVQVKTDSQLLCNQINGRFKVKDAKIKILYEQALHLISGFDKFKIDYISRKDNKGADRLATQAIKREQAKVVTPASCRRGKSELQRAAYPANSRTLWDIPEEDKSHRDEYPDESQER